MKTILHKLSEFFLENTAYKILSLVIALFVWMSIITEENVEETVYVSIKINKPSNVIIVNDVPREVALSVSGSRSAIKSLASMHLEAPIDIDDHALGIGSYRIVPEKMNIPQSLVINSINPAVVLINVEALTEKEVPVVPRFVGALPKGYALKRYTVSPPVVAITGAERFVNVTRKVFLKAIDLEEIEEVPDSGSLTIKTLVDFTTKNIWLQNQVEFSVELIIERL